MMNNQTMPILLSNSQSNKVVNLSRRKRFINRCRYYYQIPKRCLLIQGLVISDSLTEMAAVSMLMTYLTDFRGGNLIYAAGTVNILEGVSGILSVPASFLKDYLGCYSMVLLTSQFYSMGLVLLGISACLTLIDITYLIEYWVLLMGLILIALGKAGSNSSCVEDFLGKQLEKKTNDENNNDPDEKRNRARQTFWMRTSQLLGQILGTALLAFIDDWRVRYGCCAFAMRFALGVFLIGSPLYATICIDGVFNCFKRATTITDTSPNDDVDEEERKQKLQVIHEEEKENERILLLLVPMSATFLIHGIVKSIGSTFFLEQGNNMDMSESTRIPIPPLTVLIIVSDFSRTVIKICIERLLRYRLTGPRKIYATLIRIGVGLIFSVICCATAQAVEAKRLEIVVKKGLQNSAGADDGDPVVPMSVFLLLPQFIFLGAMKGLTGDGMEGFFESELPKCKKRYASEFTTAVTGIGTILSVALVSITAKVSTIGGGSSWFGNTINRSHLDHFYRGLTMLCLIMCFVYAYVSTSYMHKRLPRNEGLDQPRLDLEIAVV